jgi:hypothetical protein
MNEAVLFCRRVSERMPPKGALIKDSMRGYYSFVVLLTI